MFIAFAFNNIVALTLFAVTHDKSISIFCLARLATNVMTRLRAFRMVYEHNSPIDSPLAISPSTHGFHHVITAQRAS